MQVYEKPLSLIIEYTCHENCSLQHKYFRCLTQVLPNEGKKPVVPPCALVKREVKCQEIFESLPEVCRNTSPFRTMRRNGSNTSLLTHDYKHHATKNLESPDITPEMAWEVAGGLR